ncbi:MAG: OsmC family peroxiredoxin [Bacteroidetes bacterium]|nr:OsmC family peroxiredoxin [Bacteroidota bacterium]MCY4234175.1 OsmC family peroxiredoxin [Bacteroidota bacterium]
MSINHATASWEGDLKPGNGHIKTDRGSLDTPFTFASRFEGASGIGPEDLVAAAISGCFSMALSNELAGQGNVVTRVDTRSTVTLGPDPAGGFHISSINLEVLPLYPALMMMLYNLLPKQTELDALSLSCTLERRSMWTHN